MPVTRPPPYLSEHTSEVIEFSFESPIGADSLLTTQVLSELEYTTEEIARLRQDKVI
jgi:hypothetical protein